MKKQTQENANNTVAANSSMRVAMASRMEQDEAKDGGNAHAAGCVSRAADSRGRPMVKRSFHFISMLLLLVVSSQAQQQNCSDTERRFEIQFYMEQQDFQAFSWDLKEGSDAGDAIISKEYKYLYQVSNVIQCLPLEDECFDFTIEKVTSAEQFRILLDGEAIPPGDYFQYRDGEGRYAEDDEEEGWLVFTTDFGDCLPTCPDGQALLDVVAFVGQSALNWRVEDAVTGDVVANCADEEPKGTCAWWSDWEYPFSDVARARTCLSMQKCYRMILADWFWSIFDKFGDRPAFHASFNNASVLDVEGFQFEAVEFGSNCSSCRSGESPFEFFALRDHNFGLANRTMSWELVDGNVTVLEGSAVPSNQSSLQYVHQCVPSDACMTFTLSVRDVNLIEMNPYRLSIDGVRYADKEYVFRDPDEGSMQTPLEETTIIGAACTTNDVCDKQSESLFALKVETGSGIWDLLWALVYTDEAASEANGWLPPVPYEDRKIEYYSTEMSYRVYHCISKIDCIAFGCDAGNLEDGDEASYSLSLDGKVLVEDREFCDGADGECPDDYIVILLGGEDCPDSAGATVGIVIGSVVGAILDLKPENVLIDADGHVKLGDFGLAKTHIHDPTEGAYSMCGTPEYMAPEVLLQTGHGFCVDYWGLGMLVYEMMTGLPPWYTTDRAKLFRRLKSAPLEIPSYFSEQCAACVSALLERSPRRRLGYRGCRHAMEHDFFRSINFRALYAKRVDPPIRPCDGWNAEEALATLNSPNGHAEAREALDKATANFDSTFTTMPVDMDDDTADGYEDEEDGEDLHANTFLGFTYDDDEFQSHAAASPARERTQQGGYHQAD